MKENTVKIIFGIRILFWLVAIGATYYWLSWSFKLYSMGIVDETEYATALRPKFYTGLLISVAAICISLVLRTISDKIKKKQKPE